MSFLLCHLLSWYCHKDLACLHFLNSWWCYCSKCSKLLKTLFNFPKNPTLGELMPDKEGSLWLYSTFCILALEPVLLFSRANLNFSCVEQRILSVDWYCKWMLFHQYFISFSTQNNHTCFSLHGINFIYFEICSSPLAIVRSSYYR